MTKKLRMQTIELINGENWVIENGKKTMMINNGQLFNGSLVADHGKWATCQNCGRRHAVGPRCIACTKERYPAKRERREHRDIRKPDNIKGI